MVDPQYRSREAAGSGPGPAPSDEQPTPSVEPSETDETNEPVRSGPGKTVESDGACEPVESADDDGTLDLGGDPACWEDRLDEVPGLLGDHGY